MMTFSITGRRALAAALGMLVAGGFVSPAVHADRFTGCERTASLLFRACLADVREERSIGQANCVNIGDEAEREACLDELNEAYPEDREECRDVREARLGVCDLLDEDIYDPDPLLNPANAFVDPDDIPDVYPPNRYLNLSVGQTSVVRVLEDGELTEEFVVRTVTDETREVLGVDCRIVVDAELEVTEDDDPGEVDYEPLEITDDEFAQTELGDIVYCGEVSRSFEDGRLHDLEGSFLAGKEGAKSGFLLRDMPAVGDAERQEYFLDEAEDVIEYISLGAAPDEDVGGNNENGDGAFSCGESDCLEVFETDPMEPGGAELEYYLPDVGFVVAVDLEDGEFTGEREEVVCRFDALEDFWTFGEDECGIEDMDELREDLCEFQPEAFCDDDEEE